ncbi:hypothetical protein VitviT2T_026600 [Vitis vinifera]|uniref:Pentatricopeptide repeat-containing protein n=2 Tax=Vitis vinifera TaxID=29760 RepID=A0ABY9DMG5_VITVI
MCKTHETHCLCCMHAACNDLLRTSSSQILGIRLMAPYRTPWSIIDSHCKSRHHNKAEELFEAMQNSGCSPFTTTYNIMINSFGEQERWEDMKTLLGKMQISWDGCHSRTWGLHSHAQPWTNSPRRSPCCNTAPKKDPLSMSCNFKEVIHSPDSYINL